MSAATVRPLTEDEARALRAQIDAQMEAFRRAYKGSIGIERHRCLLSALALCGPLVPDVTDSNHRVPKWLYEALCEREAAALRQVEPDIHWVRWLIVCEGKRQKRRVLVRGKWQEKPVTWPEAYTYASEKLTRPPYSGTPRTMKASYLVVQNERKRRSRVR